MRGLAHWAGFGSGWAGFTVLLALATRPMGLGPGFSNLVPYAVAAILMTASGHLARRWLGEAPSPGKPQAGPAFRRAGRAWLDGLRAFFLGTAAFNNFLLLSLAYLAGIGLTSLFLRKQRKQAGGPGPRAESYWEDLNLGKREADAYYRPF